VECDCGSGPGADYGNGAVICAATGVPVAVWGWWDGGPVCEVVEVSEDSL
jgi:hypothetical protein